MAVAGSQWVDVFPISTSAFGLRADWFESYAPKFLSPAYLLMSLLLVVSVAIMALKRFEHADLEKKVWNLPVTLVIVAFWPSLVLGLKDLVDSFNTFIVHDVFHVSWAGFGFPELKSVTGLVGWSAEGLARLLPNLAYWIVYAFFIVFFFFYAVLGPLILAKGILFDEIEAFLELVKEITILFLWQTTIVVLVCFIMPEIVSGQAFPVRPPANFYFLSLILGIMIFFAPSLSRKFGNHLGSSFIPAGFKWGGAAVGLAGFAKLGAGVLGVAGFPIKPSHRFEMWKERFERAEEFKERYTHGSHIRHLHHENHELERELHADHDEHEDGHHGSLVAHSRRAKDEHSAGGH